MYGKQTTHWYVVMRSYKKIFVLKLWRPTIVSLMNGKHWHKYQTNTIIQFCFYSSRKNLVKTQATGLKWVLFMPNCCQFCWYTDIIISVNPSMKLFKHYVRIYKEKSHKQCMCFHRSGFVSHCRKAQKGEQSCI